MSSSRIKYDKECISNQNNNDSSINNYLLNMPENDCNNCYPGNPEIRFQKKSLREDTNVENELFGIDRKDTCNNEYKGCVDGVCKTQEFDHVDDNKQINECNISTISSRFNSVKNLKELSVNRWEWLPKDPQKHALSEVYYGMSSRNHVKDNYKADYDTPMDANNELEEKKIESKFTVPVKVTPFN
jgi:hypothetical protein